MIKQAERDGVSSLAELLRRWEAFTARRRKSKRKKKVRWVPQLTSLTEPTSVRTSISALPDAQVGELETKILRTETKTQATKVYIPLVWGSVWKNILGVALVVL